MAELQRFCHLGPIAPTLVKFSFQLYRLSTYS